MKILLKKFAVITFIIIISNNLLISVASAYTPEEEANCLAISGVSCAELNKPDAQKEAELNAAIDAENKDDAYCQTAYKMSCAQYIEQNKTVKEKIAELEKECQNQYGMSCAEYAQKARNASGQGFKLPLDFLTLTTKDSKGNKVTQGQSIFANKDYPVEKYGVLLGTFLRIIDILVYVIGSLALLTLIVAGIMMIANHGDEGWVTKGKGMMLYSILGVIFALLSFIFVNIVTSLLS